MNLITTDTNKTMTSMEIAGLTKKNHKEVMRDIRILIDQGAIGERNFALTSYKSDQNKSLPMYELDFKATMILVTGYDAKRRAAVIDRWIKVETGQEAPAFQNLSLKRTLTKTATDFKALKNIATIAGLEGNPAILSANSAMIRIHNENPLELVGQTHLITEDQQRHFTPTEIGAQIGGKSGQFVNKILTDKIGFQEKVKTGKKSIYVPTPKGKGFAVLIDSGKQHSDGSMIQQVRWREGVVQLVREATA